MKLSIKQLNGWENKKKIIAFHLNNKKKKNKFFIHKQK